MPSSDGAKGHDLTPQDFEAIRDAVMETPRGRWFLGEYANRLRSAETTGLLDSMKRLENAVSSNHDQLMARLGQALVREAAPSAPVPQPHLAPKHMKFFKQDEEIFEPAPQAKIAAVPDVKKPEPKPEVPRGAKVVIRRAAEASALVETPAEALPVPPAAEVAPPPPPAAEPQPQPQAQTEAPKRRIVIIRHKPGEQIDVPFTDDVAKAG